MQGGRPNTGKVSVPLGGKQAARLSSTGQAQARPFKPAQWGTPDAPGTGQNRVPPASGYQRPQASGAQPVHGGSREIGRYGSAELVQAGSETGTPPQPVQRPEP
jgi:hypothetical protein